MTEHGFTIPPRVVDYLAAIAKLRSDMSDQHDVARMMSTFFDWNTGRWLDRVSTEVYQAALSAALARNEEEERDGSART